jgi:prolipoprotein diacylglyceryltransferase
MIFGFRFIVEFVKEDQTYFEEGMVLNMGQLLSIPLIIAGIYFVYTRFPKNTAKKV